jgi:sortase A
MVEGTGKEPMLLGAGHLEETPLPGMGGNFALAGDRVLYTAPFLRLNQLQKGDDIIIHMPYGDLTYRVESMFNIDPSQVSVLNPRGYDSITLSTCDPTWQLSTRLIVSARLFSVDSPS